MQGDVKWSPCVRGYRIRASEVDPMLLSLVFAVMVGGGPLVPTTGVPVDVQTTAGTTDENAPVAVPPAGEKAMSYYRSGNVLWVIDIVWSMAMLVLILATGFSATLRDWSQRVGRRSSTTITRGTTAGRSRTRTGSRSEDRRRKRCEVRPMRCEMGSARCDCRARVGCVIACAVSLVARGAAGQAGLQSSDLLKLRSVSA